MIVLRNQGLLEIDLITTMGANVKESSDAIGQFGTGLKYAIAVLLREAINIELAIGQNVYSFYTKTKNIRGKDFELCYMGSQFDSVPLGFTTELGKNWFTWQAYRELYTNCVLDENGEMHREQVENEEGYTTFRIFDDIDTDNVFIRDMGKSLLLETEDVDVYEGNSQYLYYQGIRAKELNKPSLYTYNIKSRCTLTEDRTIAYDFQVSRMLAETIVQLSHSDELMIGRILNAKDKYFESRIDYSEAERSPSEAFSTAYNNSPTVKQNSTASAYMHRHTPKKEKTKEEKKQEFISDIESLCDDYNIEVEHLDQGIMIPILDSFFE